MLTINGRGYPFAETGTEGVCWAIVDPNPSKVGYDNLYVLTNGDILTVFDRKAPSKVVWSGMINFEYTSHCEQSSFNPEYRSQAIFNHWVNGLQKHIPAETWASYFFEQYPMRLERACAWEIFREFEKNSFQKASLCHLGQEDREAMLEIKVEAYPAKGKPRYFYQQTKNVMIHLTRADVEALRDTCEAILRSSSVIR